MATSEACRGLDVVACVRHVLADEVAADATSAAADSTSAGTLVGVTMTSAARTWLPECSNNELCMLYSRHAQLRW